jgi:hypothetical protein
MFGAATYPRTVLRSFLWKLTPERGTIVMISCLCSESVASRIKLRVNIPAANRKKQEGKSPEHGVDTEIKPKTLVGVLLVELCP